MVNPGLYNEMNRRWKEICKVLLKQELGELADYREFLQENRFQFGEAKARDGSSVVVSDKELFGRQQFIPLSQLQFNKKLRLDIDEIKDIEGIIQGIGEQVELVGNRVLGTSKNVEESDIILDSFHVLGSSNIAQSSYVCDSYMVRKDSRNIFGTGYGASGEFLIKVMGMFHVKRCFECSLILKSSDLYFSHNCYNCNDLLFSFGQRGKRNMIGNLALPKDKFGSLKEKLLAEIAEQVRKNRLSMKKLMQGLDGQISQANLIPPSPAPTSMERIDEAWKGACRSTLGFTPGKLKDYEPWLEKHIPANRQVKSAFGSMTGYPEGFPVFSEFPQGRIVTQDESLQLGELLKLDGDELGSLGSISRSLGRIAFFTSELIEGQNSNVIDSLIVFNGTDVYRTFDLTDGRAGGISFMALEASYSFGCFRVVNSNFTIKCYNSAHLTRCLELESCDNCSDSFFCYNSENLSNSLFCFNAKALRNAIGNNELEKGKFSSLKGVLVSQLAQELERRKGIGIDIFGVMGGKES